MMKKLRNWLLKGRSCSALEIVAYMAFGYTIHQDVSWWAFALVWAFAFLVAPVVSNRWGPDA